LTRWDIACASDDAYLPHSAAMVHSALTAPGAAGVRIHYLHGPELSSRGKQKLARMIDDHGGEVTFLEVPDRWLDSLPIDAGKTIWYRLFVPRLVGELDRILYLDVDAIIVDSLQELWELDLSGSYLAAVTNVFESYYAHRPEALGLPGRDAYFNAGMMLLNLDLMRREDCTEALLEFTRAHTDLLWHDQDAYNGVLASRRLPLHPRWNAMNSLYIFPWSVEVYGEKAVEQARRNPAIRHFEGPTVNKPWHFLCEREMRDLYRREGVSATNVMRRLRRDLLGRPTPPVPPWVRP
jgi:lipopolysaccharide biosynthesis glycosyltransferase